MNDDLYWLQTYEHVFSLGCKIPLIAEEQLPIEAIRYQSLRITLFNTVCLISVLQVGQMAELEFCAQSLGGHTTKEVNAGFRWICSLAIAFKVGIPLPSALPPYFYFIQGRAELTLSQIHWLESEMERIQPLTITSLNMPATMKHRRGEVSSGSIKVNGQPVHCFYYLNYDSFEPRQIRYHQVLYRLAVNTISDPECAQILKNMRGFHQSL